MPRSIHGRRLRTAEERAKFLEIRRTREAFYAARAHGEKPAPQPEPAPEPVEAPAPAPVLKPGIDRVEIPADWRTLSWQSRRRLAAGLSDTPILNSDDAEAAIVAALKRREG